MRIMKSSVLVAVAIVGAYSRLMADEPVVHWVPNLGEAKRIAQAQDKDLLINFTGLSWCGYCKLLDAEVFSKPEFAAAAHDFVLVEIDYPGSVDLLKGDMKEWFPKLRDYYMVKGYPTVVVADARGLPIAYTGYDYGLTPETFLKKLAIYRAGRQARDKALAEAAAKTGDERAEKLDEALKAVNLNLGSMYSRKVDPLFAYYGDIVEEIKSLDAASGKLAGYYEKRAATRKEWEERPGVAVFEELRQFRGPEDAPAAIELLDQALTNVANDDDLRWRLELARQSQLELLMYRQDASDEERKLNGENALANARRLLGVPTESKDTHYRLRQREASVLARLGRVDEMIDVYDRLIGDESNSPARRLSLLRDKATTLIGRPDVERTLAAFRDYQAETKPNSDDWADALGLTALVLERAERWEEAIALRKQLVAARPDSFGQFVAMARDQQSLGQLADASKSLDEAESRAKAFFAKDTKRADLPQRERFEKEVARLRQLVAPSE